MPTSTCSIDDEVCSVVMRRQQVLFCFSLSDRWMMACKNSINSFFSRIKKTGHRRKYIEWIWCGVCWTCAMKPHQMNRINRPMNCFHFNVFVFLLLSVDYHKNLKLTVNLKYLQWKGEGKTMEKEKKTNCVESTVSQFNGFESDGFPTIPYVPYSDLVHHLTPSTSNDIIAMRR